MKLATTIAAGLKEWDIVCRALEAGRQMLLLRKGGIYESAGEFEIEHRQFALFPTFVHQNPAMLKPEVHGDLRIRAQEPQTVELRCIGHITDIIPAPSRAWMDARDRAHLWSPALIEMRFNYKPQNPLYLLLVRAYRLARPVQIVNTPAYAGCKSWVPLDQPISATGATPVLEDGRYEQWRREILQD